METNISNRNILDDNTNTARRQYREKSLDSQLRV